MFLEISRALPKNLVCSQHQWGQLWVKVFCSKITFAAEEYMSKSFASCKLLFVSKCFRVGPKSVVDDARVPA